MMLFKHSLLLFIIFVISHALPVPSGNNIFRLFYDKPEINSIQGKLIQLTKVSGIIFSGL